VTTDATREHCVDAETLAAWADRGLPAADAAAVELHLSNCERCQEVLAAFVRSQPQAAVVLPFWSRPAVRLAAAGLAVAASVTLVVWTNRPPSVPVPTATVASSELAPAAPSLIPAPAPAPAPAAPPPAPAAAAPDRARQAAPSKQAEARRSEPAARPAPLPTQVAAGVPAAAMPPPATLPPAPLPAAAPPPPPVQVTAAAPVVGGTARQAAGATRPTAVVMDAMAERVGPEGATIEIIAPDPLATARMAASGVAGGRGGGVLVPTRWRILSGTRVQRSVDGGTTWTVADLPSDRPFVLTAGSAASQNLCWLVGRDGAVFLTRNGLTFERVSFPLREHLRSVRAIDTLRAVVTTEDGRTFSTSDGGLTWVAGGRPQGF
jgi:hypothetical protein